jgi:hypothetical protein
MPGRRVTANDIVYTFFLFDTDVQRHVVFFFFAGRHVSANDFSPFLFFIFANIIGCRV